MMCIIIFGGANQSCEFCSFFWFLIRSGTETGRALLMRRICFFFCLFFVTVSERDEWCAVIYPPTNQPTTRQGFLSLSLSLWCSTSSSSNMDAIVIIRPIFLIDFLTGRNRVCVHIMKRSRAGVKLKSDAGIVYTLTYISFLFIFIQFDLHRKMGGGKWKTDWEWHIHDIFRI